MASWKKHENVLTEKYLYTEYVSNNRSISSISKELSIKRETVKKYLLKHSIPLHLPDYTKRSTYCNGHWGGHEEIPLTYWNNVIKNSKKRNVPFTITIQDGWRLFLKQRRKCNLSGMPIEFLPQKKTTASLDRIDSSRGYDIDNVQWLHKKVNKLKSDFTVNELVHLCKEISSFLNEKSSSQFIWRTV